MNFAVVEFLDEQAVEVVPKDWIEKCDKVRRTVIGMPIVVIFCPAQNCRIKQ